MNHLDLLRAAAAALFLVSGAALAQDCQLSGGGTFEDTSAFDDGTGSCRSRARFSGSIIAPFDGTRCDSFNPEGEWELTLSDGRSMQAVDFEFLTFRVDGLDIATARGTGLFEGDPVEFDMYVEGISGRPGTDIDYIVVIATYTGGLRIGDIAFDSRGPVVGGNVSMVPD